MSVDNELSDPWRDFRAGGGSTTYDRPAFVHGEYPPRFRPPICFVVGDEVTKLHQTRLGFRNVNVKGE